MKWKIIIGALVLAGVAVLCYQLGHRASVRDQIAIDNRNACLSHLRMLDGAVQQWALDHKKAPYDTSTNLFYTKVSNDIPTWADLGSYLHLPKDEPAWTNCPSGGTYSFRRIDQSPICSFPGHQLPE